MSINATILTALKAIAPVSLHQYNGTAPEYITFFTYHARSAVQADDIEQMTKYTIQIDCFSNGNVDKLAKQVKQALKPLGFFRVSEMDIFNSDTKTYRKMITFSLVAKAED